jgi:hypothetical protein
MSNAHTEFWDSSSMEWKSRLNSRDVTLQQPGDCREQRKAIGLVKYKPDNVVTDTRGPGWRTRQGHMVKNQAFYRLGTGQAQNVWDDPIHTGTRSWKYYHGPKIRTDSRLMEKLDQQDDDQERLLLEKHNVNARRVDNLARTRMRREENYQFARSASWAPSHRAVKERIGHGPGNTSEDYNDFNSLPVKALKQVFTKSVLDKDKVGVEYIATRLQQEEKYKAMYQEWKKYRRNDTLQAFRQQRTYNDTLEQMSGQPPRVQAALYTKPVLSRRIDKLSLPKEQFVPEDVTNFPDFRGLVHADSRLALQKLFPAPTTGHGEEPRWHDTRTVMKDTTAHELLRTDHVRTSPRSQSVPHMDGHARAPPAPHTYEIETFPRMHTNDVDPNRYKYRVLTPPPTETYTYTVDVPSANETRAGAAGRWERTSTQLRTGQYPEDGDRAHDWRQQAGPPHAGEQVFRPSVSETALLEAQDAAYVAPQGRLRVGRGMSAELLHGDESKTFVTHKGFSNERAHTRDKQLEPRQPMPRQKDTTRNVLRQSSAPLLVEQKIPSFKETSGFSHHSTGFEPVAPNTASIMRQTAAFDDKDDDDDDDMPRGMLCDDPRFGNFALRPARATCILTTRPRLGGSAGSAFLGPGPESDGPSVDFGEYM